MVQRLELSPVQSALWDRLSDDRALLEAREARTLAAMLQELGGRMNEPWQFDRATRVFWMNVPDNPLESDAVTANADASGT